MYTGDVDEDEIMAVEGQDGNQYVVLEVIQLQVRSRSFMCWLRFLKSFTYFFYVYNEEYKII